MNKNEPDASADDGSAHGRLRIALAINHPGMRSLVADLLVRELGCRIVSRDVHTGERVIDLTECDAELLVIDESAFSAARDRNTLPGRETAVIVVGPEPDPSYRDSALAAGAQAWLARDRVGDDLLPETLRVLGANITATDSRPQGRAPAGPELSSSSASDKS